MSHCTLNVYKILMSHFTSLKKHVDQIKYFQWNTNTRNHPTINFILACATPYISLFKSFEKLGRKWSFCVQFVLSMFCVPLYCNILIVLYFTQCNHQSEVERQYTCLCYLKHFNFNRLLYHQTFNQYAVQMWNETKLLNLRYTDHIEGPIKKRLVMVCRIECDVNGMW